MKHSISYYKFWLAALLLILCFTPRLSSAHLVGNSWEKIVNNYKIDIGYDVNTFVAGQSVRLDFNLIPQDITSGQVGQKLYTDVWVRVENGGETVFATGLQNPDYGPIGMIYTFPGAGNYTLDARFENNSDVLAEWAIPISVTDPAPPPKRGLRPWMLYALSGAGGILIGALLGRFVWRRKKKN